MAKDDGFGGVAERGDEVSRGEPDRRRDDRVGVGRVDAVEAGQDVEVDNPAPRT